VFALATKVVVEVTARALTSPILNGSGSVMPTIQRMQRLIEAARQVDAQAAMAATLQPALATTILDLTAWLRTCNMVREPELAAALVQCWKTLTGANDLDGCLILLHSARLQWPTTQQQIRVVVKFVQDACEQLKTGLASRAVDVRVALQVYAELIDFIVGAVRNGADLEWGMQGLAGMSSLAQAGPLCQVEPNAAVWPLCGRVRISIGKGKLAPGECLTLLSECAAVQGVWADVRVQTMFQESVVVLLMGSAHEHAQVTVGRDWFPPRRALQAFLIGDSIRMIPDQLRSPVSFAAMVRLLSEIIEAIEGAVDLGVDIPKAVSALMAHLLAQDAYVAFSLCESFWGSDVIRQSHPLLGISLCTQLAAYFRAKNDLPGVDAMVAKALMQLPSDETLRLRALEILKPFWQN